MLSPSLTVAVDVEISVMDWCFIFDVASVRDALDIDVALVNANLSS
jgi:hypothetical protein